MLSCSYVIPSILLLFRQGLRIWSYVLQIHCINATTLERDYTILTNPIVTGCPTSGGISCGPLAVGPRWLAYSGSPVVVSNSGRVSPQHMTSSASFSGFPSNGSLVAHYAKESSKQIAAGIVTLGDMGYKKLSRYCSELLPDSNNSHQLGSPSWKGNGTVNGHLAEADSVGVVCIFRFYFIFTCSCNVLMSSKKLCYCISYLTDIIITESFYIFWVASLLALFSAWFYCFDVNHIKLFM